MSGMIRQRIQMNYVRLSATDKLEKAREALKGQFGVIVDDEQKPVTMVSPTDLERIDAPGNVPLHELFAQLPPGLVTAANANLDDFVNGLEITALDIGARGVMVYDETGLVGILASQTIDQYIAEEYKPVGQIRAIKSLVSLAGDIVTKPIIMYCTDYNHRNELEYFDPDNPPECQVSEPETHPVRRLGE